MSLEISPPQDTARKPWQFQPGNRFGEANRGKSAVSWRQNQARALALAPECIDLLIAIVRDGRAPLKERRACAIELLDRGMGKPIAAVAIQHLGVEGHAVESTMTAAEASLAYELTIRGGPLVLEAEAVEDQTK